MGTPANPIMRFKADEKHVRILGRTKVVDDIRYINYSCSGIEFEFTGTSTSVVLCTDISGRVEAEKAYIAVFQDDDPVPCKRIPLDSDEEVYKIYESDMSSKVKIRIMKMSEASCAKVGIKEIIIEGDKGPEPTQSKERRIEFIGDSITCGYGIEGVWNKDTFNTRQENPWDAYAAKTARYFDADFNCVSWSGIGVVSSWTDSDVPNTELLMPMLYKYTDASLDIALKETKGEIWDNKIFEPHLIVINLGTNDSSYTKGIKERVDQFTAGYYKLLEQVREGNPDSVIICGLGVMGQDLCPAVEAAVNDFRAATGDQSIHTLIFEVQSESDGIGADWHPNLISQDRTSKKLIEKIEEVMYW